MNEGTSTKDFIADTFLELAKQKPVNKITVREIAAACKITTATFYNYFRDKYELIVALHIRSANKIMDKISGDYTWKNSILDGIHYFAEQRHFMLNALHHTSGHDSFIRHVEYIHRNLLAREVQKSFGVKSEKHLPREIQYSIDVYCSGTVRVLFDWLIEDCPCSEKELAGIFENCLPQVLRKYLYETSKNLTFSR
ncbi:TetR/AcrR family transcriptional regulator C-terminal domain-containing protein [Treponema sp.]|uniref:TetR/AcrR family transcriptional regulator n=1 Tax=Treponema sp. TaxID=166 RepID=UPI0025FC887E|nr:TetR/AcrR family transcriptional regulator C-terminal domain-containing protein [Treponema sp.]MBR4321740.1 TetR/AcrR family transcriptional regulator C-terminal domain-containing protein [Treponema sp.]